jgi:hypothetical protein
MQRKKIKNRLGWPATHAAFSRDPKLGRRLLSGRNALGGTFEPVGAVNQAQKDLRRRWEFERAQGREIGIVAPIARYRQMDPIERPRNCGTETIGRRY